MHKGSASFNQRRLSQDAPTRETKAGRESQGLEVCVPRNAVRKKLPNSARKLLAKHNRWEFNIKAVLKEHVERN
jgi:hypothetical protein